ncbi:amino acid adenylation domain-containing protein [Amycolatopsis acidiphila]
MHEWFSTSARAYASEPALEVAGEVLTYEQLRIRAERLADRVVEANNGAVPRRIGLLAGRSVLAYTGYLAIASLGAAVVPLNPGFPEERNAAIAGAAGLDFVLAQEDCSVRKLSARALTLPASPNSLRGQVRPRARSSEPDRLCYILFTSGSTGRPKGVPIRHQNLAAFLTYVIDRYGLMPGDRVSQTFDLTFDLSVFDLFATWGAGATLVVPSRAELLAPARFVAARGLTHWFSVPSVVSFAMRLRALSASSMPALRWSLFCGEPLTVAHARAWQAAAPASVIENLYGPTELTLSCSQYRVSPHSLREGRSGGEVLPIGQLYPGLERLVLNEQGFPDTEGELCVRGVQRFPGYLDPADNAGRFVEWEGGTPRVVSEPIQPSDRLWYRTGDRVRLSDVGLVHLGRTDQQVKIRGYRVELGDVESVLRSEAGVVDAVAFVVSIAGNDEVVAACTGRDLDAVALTSRLRERLPEYMAPSSVTVFREFPLSASGKVDRRSLLAKINPGSRREVSSSPGGRE